MKNLLALEDLVGRSEEEIKSHLCSAYSAPVEEVKPFKVLIAYESVGNWGCDSSSFFLLEKDEQLFELHGSHCSCYGFEDQWKPEPTTLAYLKSDKFHFCTGGYDSAEASNKKAVRDYLKAL